MRTTLTITFVLVLVIGVGYLARQSPDPTPETASNVAEPNSGDDASATASTDDTPSDTSKHGTYTTYDETAVADSQADRIFLFFHATWCPSCRVLDQDITANRSEIPADVAIYRVDFDTATDLRRSYGITTQHSVIEIDTDGTAASDITHPRNLEGLLTNTSGV